MITKAQAAKRLKVTVRVIDQIIARGMVSVDADGGLDEGSWGEFHERVLAKGWLLLVSEEELRDHVFEWATEPLRAKDITRRILNDGLAIGKPKGISGALRGWLTGDRRFTFKKPRWVRQETSVVRSTFQWTPYPPPDPFMQLIFVFCKTFQHLPLESEDFRLAQGDPFFRRKLVELQNGDPLAGGDGQYLQMIWEGGMPLPATIRHLAHERSLFVRADRAEEIIAAIMSEKNVTKNLAEL